MDLSNGSGDQSQAFTKPRPVADLGNIPPIFSAPFLFSAFLGIAPEQPLDTLPVERGSIRFHGMISGPNPFFIHKPFRD